MSYRTLIQEIDPTCNPRAVEAMMRMQYGTLDHLPRETFAAEIKLTNQCEAAEPGFGERLARSYGL